MVLKQTSPKVSRKEKSAKLLHDFGSEIVVSEPLVNIFSAEQVFQINENKYGLQFLWNYCFEVKDSFHVDTSVPNISRQLRTGLMTMAACNASARCTVLINYYQAVSHMKVVFTVMFEEDGAAT